MFKGLKDKLKSFLGKDQASEKPKKETKKKDKSLKSKDKKSDSKIIKKTPLPSDQELKKQAEGIDKTIQDPKQDIHKIVRGDWNMDQILKEKAKNLKEPPQKFNAGTQKYEPDLEKIEEEINEKTTPKEKPKKGFFSKILKGTSTIKEEHLDSIWEPLELILLENNVNLNVVDKIHEDLKKDLLNLEVKKQDIEKTIQESLKSSIQQVLIEPPNLIEEIKEHNKKTKEPYTIIFFGINGSGKTTSIAKLTHLLQKSGIKPVLAAGDTFRAASIEQLKTHAGKLKTPIIAHDYNSDPAAVAFDAKDYAKKHNLDCVLVDTAGRMYTKTNLMKEMEKIIRVSKPDLKIFVAESTTGNDATQQASMFDEAIGIEGIILTKADVDEKGGAALSVSYITKKPIYFLGIGQEYEDLKPFNKETIIKNLGLD